MKIFLKAFAPLFVSISFLFLTACGGSSGGASSSTGPAGSTPLSAEEFAKALTTGIIRVDVAADFSSPVKTIELGGTTYTLNITGETKASQVLSLLVESDKVTTDNCSLSEPEVETDLSGSVLDDGEVDFSGCSDSYFKISDSKFRIELNCTGLIPDTVADFTYISNDSKFNLGKLTMDFGVDSFDDVTVSDGVCGSTFLNDTVTEVTPAGLLENSTVSETAVEIVAPYVNGFRVKLDLNFSGAGLSAGEYIIVNTLSGAVTREVTLKLSSAEFGGFPESPFSLSATGGVVTITAVSDKAYGGTYNVTLSNGDSLTGSFSLDLN